jgi:hypothetical protein
MSEDRVNTLREAQKDEAHRFARAVDADRQRAEGKKPLKNEKRLDGDASSMVGHMQAKDKGCD